MPIERSWSNLQCASNLSHGYIWIEEQSSRLFEILVIEAWRTATGPSSQSSCLETCPCPLADHFALEFCDRAKDREHETPAGSRRIYFTLGKAAGSDAALIQVSNRFDQLAR